MTCLSCLSCLSCSSWSSGSSGSNWWSWTSRQCGYEYKGEKGAIGYHFSRHLRSPFPKSRFQCNFSALFCTFRSLGFSADVLIPHVLRPHLRLGNARCRHPRNRTIGSNGQPLLQRLHKYKRVSKLAFHVRWLARWL